MKELLILLIGIGLGITLLRTMIKDTGISRPYRVQPEIQFNCTGTKCDTIYNYKF